jgi:carboxyl-terminal processing protease
MLKKFPTSLVLLLLLLIISGGAFSQTKRTPRARPHPTATPSVRLTAEQQVRMEAFDTVWKTIKDNYFDQTFNGLNWDSIRKEYQPKILKASGSFQFHSILQEMISRLDRSHFMIIPPEVYRELEKARSEVRKKEPDVPEESGAKTGEGGKDDKPAAEDFFFDDTNSQFGIGVDIRVIAGQIVITEVEPHSAAEKAGLKTGFVIDKINNVSMRQLWIRMMLGGSYGKLAEKVFSIVVLTDFINGEKESAVSITYLDDQDKANTIDIQRERLNGKLIKPVPNFPRQFFSFETRSLDDDTGYIRFNMFAIGAVEGMCRALSEFKDKKAVIVDLRGNIGGSIGALMGITSMLIDKPVSLGTQIYKNSRESVLVLPQGRKYSGKLIVLIDSMSHSAAEIFASGLQESGRLKVVGEKSAGEALPSTTLKLATGALFMYPFANFQTPDGKFIEGVGVQPDLKVLRERADLLTGKDVQLDAARTLIKAESSPAAGNGDNEKPPPPPLLPPPPALKRAGSDPLKIPATDQSPPPPVTTPAKIEKKYEGPALKAVDEYIAAAGGKEALKKFSSYSAFGQVELSRAGTRIEGIIQLIGKTPDKNAEILTIDAVGEVRGIFDGKKYYLQSDLTGNSDYDSARQMREMSLASDLQEMLKIKDTYNQLLYVGEYDRNGKAAILLRAITADGVETAFVFDKVSKLLLQRTGAYLNSSYGDYRKVDGLMVPFWQTRSDSMVIKLSEFKLNVPVEDSFFVPKDNCFSVQKQ